MQNYWSLPYPLGGSNSESLGLKCNDHMWSSIRYIQDAVVVHEIGNCADVVVHCAQDGHGEFLNPVGWASSSSSRPYYLHPPQQRHVPYYEQGNNVRLHPTRKKIRTQTLIWSVTGEILKFVDFLVVVPLIHRPGGPKSAQQQYESCLTRGFRQSLDMIM